MFEDAILAIPGADIRTRHERRILSFPSTLTWEEAGLIISLLRKHKIDFEVYDFFYPSPSDPGAYITYFLNEGDEGWKMTLGNHGWTGGVYTITDNVIQQQLYSLAGKTGKLELSIDNVRGFRHYSEKSPEQNKKENEKIYAMHGGA